MEKDIIEEKLEETNTIVVNEEEAEAEGKKKASGKNIIAKVALLAVILIFTLLMIFQMEDIGDIAVTLKTVKIEFIFAALGLLAAYVILNGVVLNILSKKMKNKIKFVDNFMITSVEYFFSGITPFAVGGQPIQVLLFKKLGVNVSDSTGLILLNYVVYQTSICILCLLSLVYYKDFSSMPGINVMLVVGFAINFLVLGVFVLLGTSKTARNIMVKLVDKILSLKFLKGKFDKNKEGFRKYCDDAQFVFKEVIKNKMSFISSIVVKVISIGLYFMIPLFILKSLGVNIGMESWFYIICMTTFSVAMTCFIPTPGASGGIEFAFITIFASIAGVTSVISASGVLLWRFITYYCLMLFSFIVYLILGYVANKRTKQIEAEETAK